MIFSLAISWYIWQNNSGYIRLSLVISSYLSSLLLSQAVLNKLGLSWPVWGILRLFLVTSVYLWQYVGFNAIFGYHGVTWDISGYPWLSCLQKFCHNWHIWNHLAWHVLIQFQKDYLKNFWEIISCHWNEMTCFY